MVVPQLANSAEPIPFDVQLMVRDAYLAVDPDPARTTLDHDFFVSTFGNVCPEHSLEQVCGELIVYLDRVLQKHGTVLEQRVRVEQMPNLPSLITADKATANLAHLNDRWNEAENAFLEWAKANPQWATNEGLVDVYKTIIKDEDLANGPLMLLLKDPDDPDKIRTPFLTGRIPFSLAAPITRSYEVRPNKNAREWETLRGSLAQHILSALHCRLWYGSVTKRLLGIPVQSPDACRT